MREATGSTWIFGLVITFTLIFAAFLILAMSYSKAYKIKNEMVDIIEKYEGITKDSVKIINNYLKNSAYSVVGKCDIGDYASTSLDSDTLQMVSSENDKYYYCITPNVDGKYTNFDVTLFYNFTLPIFGKLNKYNISGQTNSIYQAVIQG